MTAKFSILLAALTYFLLGTAAHALTISQTLSFDIAAPTVTFAVSNDNGDVTITPSLPVPPGTASQVLTFTKFDTTLGTLTGVTITFATTAYTATATVGADNQGFTEATFFADAAMDRSLSGLLITNATSQQTFNANCETDPSVGPSSCGNSTTNNFFFDGTAVTGAHSSFGGPGTFDLTAALSSTLAPRVTPDNGTGFADNATFNGTLNADWEGAISVVYTYVTGVAAVPEPLSLYLLAAGLGGIALVRRRRS